MRALRQVAVFVSLGAVGASALHAQGRAPAVAIVGATVIDGNGGPAVPDATIVVDGPRGNNSAPATPNPQTR